MLRWKEQLTLVLGIAIVATLALAAPPEVLAQAAVRPVIVVNADNPDQKVIFQEDLTMLQFDPLEGSSECMPALPAGKRLVIEHVTARVRLPIGQQGYVALKTHALHIASMLPLTPQMTELGHTTYAAAVPLKLRIDPPNLPCFLFERDEGAGQGTALFTISGYLVDMPR